MKFKFYVGFIVMCIFFSSSLRADCDEKTKKEIIQLIQKDPFKIYKNILQKFFLVTSNKSELFDKNFEKAWDEWRDYSSCANQFILLIYSDYKNYISKVTQINDAIKLIQEITKSTEPRLAILRKRNELELARRTMEGVFKFALNSINDLERPDAWKKGVVQLTPERVLPRYKEFFRAYRNWSPYISANVIDFLIEQKGITKISNKNDIVNIGNFIDTLEKLTFLFEQALKNKYWFQSKSDLQRMILSSDLIIEELHFDYPSIVTPLMFEKFKVTKNFAAMALIAESENLISLIQKMKELEKK
jgi:hypothetical protein